ncbi:MAG: dephospho-CoA kinase [Bifidobacteriaceae bacterium]|nr:dephospho-CoA kinase [Bifidobacteriaceae bacterium]
MLRVALTGGLAAGKSTASAYLRELGYPVVSADVLAREAVAVGSDGLARVVEAFGPAVLTASGELDRAALAEIVFNSPAERLRLEGIIHPIVRTETLRFLEAAEAAGAPAAIVDVPLLVETGQTNEYDLVVLVSAPVDLRLVRARERGLSRSEAIKRIAAQADDRARQAAAHIVLDGSRSVAELLRQIDESLIPILEHGES